MFRGFGSGIGMRLRTKVILWVAALAFIAMLVIFSEEPGFPELPDTCPEKGIDPQEMKEGTCYDRGTTDVVVNEGDALRLETLEARLEGIHEAASLSGPAGTKRAEGRFVIFDVAITNRAAYSTELGKDQLALLVGNFDGPDLEAERRYEPHALLAHRHPIRPGETVHGTVVFQLSTEEAEQVTESGNLDIVDFGVQGEASDPKAAFSTSLIGVMRTYRKN